MDLGREGGVGGQRGQTMFESEASAKRGRTSAPTCSRPTKWTLPLFPALPSSFSFSAIFPLALFGPGPAASLASAGVSPNSSRISRSIPSVELVTVALGPAQP